MRFASFLSLIFPIAFLAPARVTAAALDLTPVPSGSAVLVAEPVAAGPAAPLADFGAGCGRYLHFVVAGQGELGQSPAWVSVDRVRREMGRADLRLTEADVQKAGRILGVPYVAIGAITGTSDHLTLRYRLWSAETGKPFAAEYRMSGSEQEITRQLPGFAGALLEQLGVKKNDIAGRTLFSADDLAAFGRLPWYAAPTATPAQYNEARRLSATLPPAGVSVLQMAASTGFLTSTTKRIVEQTPGNVLVYGEVARLNPAMLEPYRAALDALIAKYPNNYSLARVHARLVKTADREERVKLAAFAVRCAPKNPDAWQGFSKELADAAQDVRKGRFWNKIPADEQQFIEGLYPLEERAARKAVDLDPLDGPAWDRLATAATFNSDETTATGALWKAIQLSPWNANAYLWGLQMFQPKWFDHPESLAKVARLASTAKIEPADTAMGLAADLEHFGYKAEAKPLYAQAIDALSAFARTHTDDWRIAETLAKALAETGQYEESIHWYNEVIRVMPNYAAPHLAIADILVKQDKPLEALNERMAASRAEPDAAQPNIDISESLLAKGDAKGAEGMARNALRREPKWSSAHLALANALRAQDGQMDAAMAEYKEALRLWPNSPTVLREMARALVIQKSYADAIEAARSAVTHEPHDADAWTVLGDASMGAKSYQDAVDAYQRALSLAPSSARAQLGLGNARRALDASKTS